MRWGSRSLRRSLACMIFLGIFLLALPSNGYTLLNNTDWSGHDIGSAKVPSAEACAELCVATFMCVAASWNGPDSVYKDNNCNLKCSSMQQVSVRGEVGVLVRANSDQCNPPNPPPPQDWALRVQQGQMRYTHDDRAVKDTLRATVGNGWLSTIVKSNTIYVAALFNGRDTASPSHRARIPATNAISISSKGSTKLDLVGCALDIEKATYFVRYAVLDSGNRSVAELELLWYAHRTRQHILVFEMELIPKMLSAESLDLTLVNNKGPASVDLKGTEIKPGVWSGTIVESELAGGHVTAVVVAADAVPSTVTLAMSAPGRYAILTAITTSVSSSNPVADAEKALSDARSAFNAGTLWKEHVDEWSNIWQSGFEIVGRSDIAASVNTSLYYILSAIRSDVDASLSPGGLASNGYSGHTFWDCETWMYPSLLMWHPTIADALIGYRTRRLDQSIAKARSYKPPFDGAMIAWESAFTGAETCPTWAATGLREIHITGDVSFAIEQYWRATHDKAALASAFPLLREMATFWVNKSVFDPKDGLYHIHDVIPPDEYVDHVSDSGFTNVVASMALNFTIDAARILNQPAQPQWTTVARKLAVLFNETEGYHPEYFGYPRGKKIKQADIVLLGFPLNYQMDPKIRAADLQYYETVTDSEGPAMTWGMHSIGHLELGNLPQAHHNFNRSFANAQEPFLVWTETPTGGATNFITGAGGYLQTVVFGFPGLRLNSDGLEMNPILFEGSSSVKLRGVHYMGSRFNLWYDGTKQIFEVIWQEPNAADLELIDPQGVRHSVKVGSPITSTLGKCTVQSLS